MTEKRFILTNPKNIFQKMKCGIDDRGNTLTFNEVVNLLNELHETIQSLISDSEKYRKLSIQFDNRNKELVSENALLEKENEQLKSFIDDLTTKGTGRIDLANGYSYSVSAVLTNWKGDVE